jgi:hypothetical protein
MDSPLGAPGGLSGSLLVQLCIQGAQRAVQLCIQGAQHAQRLPGSQDLSKSVLLHLEQIVRHSPSAGYLVTAIHLDQSLLALLPWAPQRSSQQLLALWIRRCCCCSERTTRHSFMLLTPRYTAATALKSDADGACHCVCAWVAVLVRLHLSGQ